MREHSARIHVGTDLLQEIPRGSEHRREAFALDTTSTAFVDVDSRMPGDNVCRVDGLPS